MGELICLSHGVALVHDRWILSSLRWRNVSAQYIPPKPVLSFESCSTCAIRVYG